MEFTDSEIFLMVEMYRKINSPFSISELSRMLGYSNYGKSMWNKPLIKKLKAMEVIIPIYMSKPIFYQLNKKKLEDALANIDRVYKILKIFENKSIFGEPKYK